MANQKNERGENRQQNQQQGNPAQSGGRQPQQGGKQPKQSESDISRRQQGGRRERDLDED